MQTIPSSPPTAIRPLNVNPGWELDAVRSAFAEAPCFEYGQAWLSEQETGFRPGNVRIGWQQDDLLVLAELSDDDIYSNATGPNQWLWDLGDVFEIFLQGESGGDSYVELHVAPTNHTLQLGWPDAKALSLVRNQEASLESYIIPGQAFQSRVWTEARNDRWYVLATIPFALIDATPGSRIAISLSRYDYTRGNPNPVISSTSPHALPCFHRQHEWRALVVVK